MAAGGGPAAATSDSTRRHGYQRIADLIRAQVGNGTLPPGAAAPTGAALSRATGYSTDTCRRTLRELVKDGTLVPGVTSRSRLRVPGPAGPETGDAARALSAGLRDRRHARGLTQEELATAAAVSVTAVRHAETGRLWQARKFWERADQALGAAGALLGLYAAFRGGTARPEGDPDAR